MRTALRFNQSMPHHAPTDKPRGVAKQAGRLCVNYSALFRAHAVRHCLCEFPKQEHTNETD